MQDKALRKLMDDGIIERIPSNESRSARKPWESPRPDRRRKRYENTPHELVEDERNPGLREMIAAECRTE